MKKIILAFIILLSSCQQVLVIPENSEPQTPIVEDIYYTIDFYSEDTLIKSISVLENTKITTTEIPSLSKEGFNFRYWELNNVQFDFNTLIVNDITLYAVFDEIIYYTINFYDFETLQATYIVENNSVFIIDEPIHYTQKERYDLSNTLFTTYWSYNNNNFNVGDTLVINSDTNFYINREIDSLYTLKEATECAPSINAAGLVYSKSLANRRLVFSAPWDDVLKKTEYIVKMYGNFDSNQTLAGEYYYVLLSTNLTATTVDEFLSGLVIPRDEGYALYKIPSHIGFVEARTSDDVDIRTTFRLIPGTQYRVWAVSAAYTCGYVETSLDLDNLSFNIIFTQTQFEKNSIFIFTAD